MSKEVYELHQRKVPQNLNVRSLNPRIRIEGTALELASAPTGWPSSGRPGLAGVSAFGFSGTNAHVLLEEAPVCGGASAAPAKVHGVPLLLSGREPEGIGEQAGRFRRPRGC